MNSHHENCSRFHSATQTHTRSNTIFRVSDFFMLTWQSYRLSFPAEENQFRKKSLGVQDRSNLWEVCVFRIHFPAWRLRTWLQISINHFEYHHLLQKQLIHTDHFDNMICADFLNNAMPFQNLIDRSSKNPHTTCKQILKRNIINRLITRSSKIINSILFATRKNSLTLQKQKRQTPRAHQNRTPIQNFNSTLLIIYPLEQPWATDERQVWSSFVRTINCCENASPNRAHGREARRRRLIKSCQSYPELLPYILRFHVKSGETVCKSEGKVSRMSYI